MTSTSIKVVGSRKAGFFFWRNFFVLGLTSLGGVFVSGASCLIKLVNQGRLLPDDIHIAEVIILFFFVFAIGITIWKIIFVDIGAYYDVNGTEATRRAISGLRQHRPFDLRACRVVIRDAHGVVLFVFHGRMLGLMNQPDHEAERFINYVKEVAGKDVPVVSVPRIPFSERVKFLKSLGYSVW